MSKDAADVAPGDVFPLLRLPEDNQEERTYRQMKSMVEQMGGIPDVFDR